MPVSGLRRAALLVSVLFLAAEIFAFAPQLHAHPASSAGLAASDECPACRVASLVVVAQAGLPLAVPLPRPAQAVPVPGERHCWLTLDRACGRAPPRR
ncbi:MAG TPA: hypothetical protein VMW75_17660 [Thermoanaerobaculia bacterium]|nr:hypothetical protein [Thermoanaerobaculia bacterium]